MIQLCHTHLIYKLQPASVDVQASTTSTTTTAAFSLDSGPGMTKSVPTPVMGASGLVTSNQHARHSQLGDMKSERMHNNRVVSS